ncbi:two-component sensor histidine kinase [Streptomyces sp. GS7]|nr:two-component sensor histidine kinase [Streptomyces sp. GS7]
MPQGRWETAALSGAALLCLALRRRWPVATLLGLAAVLGALPAAGLPTAMAACTAGRAAAARPGSGLRWRLPALGGATVLPVLTAIPDVGLGMVLSAVAVAGPGLVGTVMGQQDRLVTALRDKAAAAEDASRLAERARIAAEMHDLIGHRLSLVSLYAGGLEMTLGKLAPELRGDAVRLRAMAGDALDELHEVLGVLGPPDDAQTDAAGSRADVEALAGASSSAGAQVRLDWTGPDVADTASSVRRALDRVIREALTNAHRYAPGAAVTVTVTVDERQVLVRVRNTAATSPPTSSGTGRGLVGIRERVGLLGGEVRTGATDDGGFAVEATLPLVTPTIASTPKEPAANASVPAPSHWPRLAAGALGLVAVAGLLVLGLRYAYPPAEPSKYAESVDSIHRGMTHAEVVSRVGVDSAATRAAAAGHAPHKPAGTTCLYPYSAETVRDGRLSLVRYCFMNGRLTSIDRFDVPVETG